MSNKLSGLAMIDIAETVLKESKEPMSISDLMDKVAEIKGFEKTDYDRMTQLYMDITESGKFVFCGDDKWDLKERNLELWDKDGYAFVNVDEVDNSEDDDDELEFTEFNLDEEDEEEKVVVVDDEEDEESIGEDADELEEEKAYIDVELPIESTDDDDAVEDVDMEFDDEFDDEEDYNDIMDDYEDMYDDK